MEPYIFERHLGPVHEAGVALRQSVHQSKFITFSVNKVLVDTT